MEHGPVPSAIYDLLKDTSGEPDEVVDALNERVEIRVSGNKRHVTARPLDDLPALSNSDKEYLLAALRQYGHLSFGKLKEISHKDKAYDEAWSKPGLNNEMDPEIWLRELEDGEAAVDAVLESPNVEILRRATA
jgi:uncharacterized phage-associated protein